MTDVHPLIFPNFDPIALHLGPLEIRWYALAYMAAFIIGLPLVKRFCALVPEVTSAVRVDDFLPWGIIGVILGGRTGYVCFYDPSYFFSHPLKIFEVWQGGMSFHGGTAGMLIAMALYCRKYGIRFLAFADRLSVVVPLGLGLGRCANFINGELWGRPVIHSVPWEMVFPHVDSLPRHPSQLYEALAEGVILFAIMLIGVAQKRVRRHIGFLSGLFLSGYAVARIVCETFREPDANIGFLFGFSTMGQLLSLPMLLSGLALMAYSFSKAQTVVIPETVKA